MSDFEMIQPGKDKNESQLRFELLNEKQRSQKLAENFGTLSQVLNERRASFEIRMAAIDEE